MQVITSLNWVLGVLAIVLALVGPKGLEYLEERRMAEVENVVAELSEAQHLYLAQNNRFLEFSANLADNQKAFDDLGVNVEGFGLGVQTPDYIYAAESGGAGRLVITARVNPQLVLEGANSPIPALAKRPRVYSMVMGAEPGTDGVGEWQPLSSGKPGLGLF